MKKLLSLLLTGTLVLFCGGVCSASEINGTEEFNLIDYCESHDIHSKAEFQSILDYYVPQEEENNTLDNIDGEELAFEIKIDYINQTVSTETLYLTDSTRGSKSGSVSEDTYSALGIKIYSITVHGSFTYTSNNVSTTSATGSFDPAPLSPWTSSPTISSGKVNGKAYARISGTASFMGNTRSYSLTLTCDTSGNLGSY